MPSKTMTNLILAAAICLSGCNAPTGLEERPSTSTTMTSASGGGGTAPNIDATSASNNGDGPNASVQDEKKDDKQEKHRFVPDRVFQVDKLQRVKASVDKHEFKLWVMDSDAKRQEGMMHLEDTDFKDNDGMIFVFSNEAIRRFWMHNTRVDLDVCYCDKDGKINTIYTMKKFDEDTDYSSKAVSMYVIELKAGILKKLGITVGMKWDIPETVVSKDDGND